MNTLRILSFVSLMALLVVIAASTSVAARDLTGLQNLSGLDLSWTVLGAGGGHAASASYSLEATLGQPLVGPSSGSAVTIAAGFWQDQAGYRVYLPIVLK